jgi:bacterioferritin
MARAFQFDVGPVVEQLNRILQMELAAIIYYTHYSFMIYGHARIPITAWLRDNATESLAHAQEAGEMIMRLHKRPALGIAALPTTPHNTIDEILTESIQREEAGVELYRELLDLVKGKSVVLLPKKPISLLSGVALVVHFSTQASRSRRRRGDRPFASASSIQTGA